MICQKRRKYKYIGICLLTLLCCFQLFIYLNRRASANRNSTSSANMKQFRFDSIKKFEAKSKFECYQPFDLKTLSRDASNTNKHAACASQEWVIIESDGTIKYNWSYLKSPGLDLHSINCKYAIVEWHKDDFNYKKSDWISISENDKLNEDYEFFLISCNDANAKLMGKHYESVFARIFKKKETKVNSKLDNREQPINVLMVGFDSVSRDNWLTHLPLSSAFIVDTMKSSILNGYNIVGDGTPAALVPMLTSKHEHELPSTLKDDSNAIYCDLAYPFIWKNFSETLGYATAFIEDWASIGTFQYRMIGMSKPPTLHYIRPIELIIEKMHDKNMCLNGFKEDLRFHFDYLNDFVRMYEKDGFFSFMFLGKYSHDSHNHLSWVDAPLAQFLADRFYATSLQDNTILVLFSDHGPRFGKDRAKISGLLQERTPFYSIYLPKLFRQRYARSAQFLVENENRLVTPMDIYATLSHLIQMESDKNEREFVKAPGERSMSLFEHIPADRSCSSAGIEAYWCSCLRRSELIVDANLITLAESLVGFINNEVLKNEESMCQRLKLKQLKQVYMLESDIEKAEYKSRINLDANPGLLKPLPIEKKYKKFIVQLETAPNNGLYEFNVEIDNIDLNKQFIEYNDESIARLFKLNAKKISRINGYGNSSKCISRLKPDLRKFCYCFQ